MFYTANALHQQMAKVARIFATAKIATLLAVCWMRLLAAA